MSDIINPKKMNIVRKSDVLVKARYKLNPLALKFITLVIANVKKSDENNKEYIFKVKDFMELADKNYKELYNELDEATEELLKSPLKIQKEKGFLKLNWISSAEYHEGEGYISFKIDSKLKPFIFDLQERFLKYDVKNILPLKSGYSIRMYEILKDWYNTSERYNNSKKVEKIAEVKWIRETLQLPASYKYNMFKRRVIEKAQKDLERNTDIKFKFEEIKTGRKVTHIKFTIEVNQANIENKDDKDKYYFLKSKQHFIAYLRKHYKNKVFLTRKGEDFEFKFFIGDDDLVYINDSYSIEKLSFEDVDSFFENVYKEAKEDKEYAEKLANKHN